MAKYSWLITVSAIVEMDEEDVRRFGAVWAAEEQLKQSVLAVLRERTREQPHTSVEWESLESTPLDGKPACGRCANCNCWVYDVETARISPRPASTAGLS